MKIFLEIISWIFICFLVLIIGQTVVSRLNIPGSYKTFLVQSGSMAPAINTGDLIFVKSLFQYQKGDIITFVDNDTKKVTHRIYEIKTNHLQTVFVTKGDANAVADNNLVDSSHIIGKVFLNLPYLGYLITFSKTLPGIITLVIIPSTIIVYDEFRKIFLRLSQK
jgi:signal peptidase